VGGTCREGWGGMVEEGAGTAVRARLVQGDINLQWVLVSDNSELSEAAVTDGALADMKKRKNTHEPLRSSQNREPSAETSQRLCRIPPPQPGPGVSAKPASSGSAEAP
jgi:hypothetical protein